MICSAQNCLTQNSILFVAVGPEYLIVNIIVGHISAPLSLPLSCVIFLNYTLMLSTHIFLGLSSSCIPIFCVHYLSHTLVLNLKRYTVATAVISLFGLDCRGVKITASFRTAFFWAITQWSGNSSPTFQYKFAAEALNHSCYVSFISYVSIYSLYLRPNYFTLYNNLNCRSQ